MKTYLDASHGERIHIRLLRQIALAEPEPGWLEELGCLPSHCPFVLSATPAGRTRHLQFNVRQTKICDARRAGIVD